MSEWRTFGEADSLLLVCHSICGDVCSEAQRCWQLSENEFQAEREIAEHIMLH